MNDRQNGRSQNQVVYELKELTKTYNGRTVLEIEHLQVGKGEILALVGPSGSGKSTLLRLLNFLEPPSSGFLSFQGREILSGPAAPLELRRRVTMVFQRPMLLDRSVEENVAFGLQLRGRRDSREPVHTALRDVGLESLARQRARTLSGGEAQRVALARAIVLKPDVLLLDEPTANLDPYNVSLIENIVRRLHREQGTTIVLVTHNVFQARRLAQRVAFLLEGRVVEIAPVTTFFESPQDERTAAFVRGDMIY